MKKKNRSKTHILNAKKLVVTVDVPSFFRLGMFGGVNRFEATGGGSSPSSLLGAGTSTGARLW